MSEWSEYLKYLLEKSWNRDGKRLFHLQVFYFSKKRGSLLFSFLLSFFFFFWLVALKGQKWKNKYCGFIKRQSDEEVYFLILNNEWILFRLKSIDVGS